MHALSTLLALCLVLLTSVAHAAILPRTSPVPCSYSCPRTDKWNRTLKDEDIQGNTILCRYNQNNNAVCNYNRSTGEARNNNGQPYCPDKAAGTSGCSKKRDALPVRKVRAEEQPSKAKNVVMNKFKKRTD